MRNIQKDSISGMKFPPQVNPATGRFEMVTGRESIQESIFIILMTHKGERFVHPDFGSNIMDFTFMENNPTMYHLMMKDLERDIKRNEPRVDNVTVELDNADMDMGQIYVNVSYTIIESGEAETVSYQV